MSAAASFLVTANDTRAIARQLIDVARRVPKPTAGFVFLTGAIASAQEDVAREIARLWPGVPTLLAAGSGVLAEGGEIEGQSAASGLLTSGGTATPFAVQADSPEELGARLASSITASGGGTVVLFAQPSAWAAAALAHGVTSSTTILGGGTAGEVEPGVVDARGVFQTGAVAALALRGTSPRIGVSPACRVLGAIGRITEARGAMVLSLDGQPALDVLSRAAQGLEGRPLVMALLPPEDVSDDSLARLPLRSGRIRPIRGVDPNRRGVMLGEPVRQGQRCGFVALDAAASRLELAAVLRDMARDSAGAAARYGLYVSCAGRGHGLYGAHDVDGKIVRARWGGLPYAGLMSSFEIAPAGSSPSMHFYTGVFGLFTSPS